MLLNSPNARDGPHYKRDLPVPGWGPHCGVQSRASPVRWGGGAVLGSAATIATPAMLVTRACFLCQCPLTSMARTMALLLCLFLQHPGSCSQHARLNHLSYSSLSGFWQGAQPHLYQVLLTRLCHILGPWVMLTLASEEFLPPFPGLFLHVSEALPCSPVEAFAPVSW